MVTQDTIEHLAITLQRMKTLMETAGLQKEHWAAYWRLSEAIYALEASAHIDAPALRDSADER
jgi:hypothetical protein